MQDPANGVVRALHVAASKENASSISPAAKSTATTRPRASSAARSSTVASTSNMFGGRTW